MPFRVFERAYVSIIDYTDDELIRGAYRGVVEEVVLIFALYGWLLRSARARMTDLASSGMEVS